MIKEESPHLSPFRSGMSATVEIQTYKNSNTLSIPIQSVTSRESKSDEKEKSEEKNFIVFVHSNGKVSERKVKTGIQDNNYISINDGLKDGEEVVTFPYSAITKNLKEGMEVKVVDQNKLFSK